MGGLTVPFPENICGHLVVELMQSKIKSIETALGLQEKYCVSKNTDSNGIPQNVSGLLGGKQAESLLVVLKGSGIEDTQDGTAPGVIEALKDKMARVEKFR